MSDVRVCETNSDTWLKEGFGSSFNLRSEDENEIQSTQRRAEPSRAEHMVKE